jgi:hypothetical protein
VNLGLFLLFSALFISSILAMLSITHIQAIAQALPTALVSAFSNALVLFIYHCHSISCASQVYLQVPIVNVALTTRIFSSGNQL